MRKFHQAITVVAALAIGAVIALAATIGQVVSTVQIMDAYKKPVTIPNIGTKVVAVFYNDYEGADVNDPCADVLKDARLDEKTFYSCGIANLKDNPMWLADGIVRLVVKGKVEKYKTDIFLDKTHFVKNAWNLGDCDNGSVTIIIGKDKRIKYLKKVTTKEESKSIAPTVLAIVRAEMKK
jgi:predicted transcriptional regulator